MDKDKKKNNEPNSDNKRSFNKLHKLQFTLQEEVVLRDIFFEDKDSLLRYRAKERMSKLMEFKYFKIMFNEKQLYFLNQFSMINS